MAVVWSIARGLYRVLGVGWDRAAQGSQKWGIRGYCGLAAGHKVRQADAGDAHGDGMMGSDGQWQWLWVIAEGCDNTLIAEYIR